MSMNVFENGRRLSKLSRRSAFTACVLALCGTWAAGAQAADPKHGREIYMKQCVNCHGDRGKPNMPGVPDFSRGERLMQSDLDLIKTISRGKGMMPAFQGILTEKDITDVIVHLRTLR